jgi:predicted dinucleotide-binding enzyme
MRIGIIGSGRIGGTLGRLFEAAGHEVLLANSRGEPYTVEAAADADLLVLAIPLHAITSLPAYTAETLAGARVVKAFNTMDYRPLGSEGKPGAPREERLAIFLAGDDEEAKRQVAELIDEIGFAPVDTGSLADSARQEPGAPVFNAPMPAPEAERALRSA